MNTCYIVTQTDGFGKYWNVGVFLSKTAAETHAKELQDAADSSKMSRNYTVEKLAFNDSFTEERGKS